MPDEKSLSTSQIVSYSLPAFGTAMVLLSVAVYLPNYYTDELGLSAGMLSWVLMAGRLWDAVTDPVMGHLSDRTRSRWGRRRPYFLVAADPALDCLLLHVVSEPGSLAGRALHASAALLPRPLHVLDHLLDSVHLARDGDDAPLSRADAPVRAAAGLLSARDGGGNARTRGLREGGRGAGGRLSDAWRSCSAASAAC